MRPLRVMVMMDEALVPPDSIAGMDAKDVARFRTEYDVLTCLRQIGHNVRPVGIKTDLGVLHEALNHFSPHVCFNLIEDFDGVPTLDQHVVSYLELLRQPYTGSNPRGLTIARDKALTKKILAYHGVAVPRFEVFPLGRAVRRPETLDFPLLVKSLTQEGSEGIAQASVVYNDQQLADRVSFVHEKLRTDAIAEQYIEGRELYIGVLGNRRLQTLPVWELCLDSLPEDVPRIATSRIKWDLAYQRKYNIASRQAADLPDGAATYLSDLAKRIYRLLDITGYARLDLRLTGEGEAYLIEANPNPQIARNEDFADSAAAAGLSYEALLQKLLSLGLTYRPIGMAA
jgi:D-alanine-D-alanine ligase